MPAHLAITPDKLARLVALPGSPRIIDLRDTPSQVIPGTLPTPDPEPDRWGFATGQSVVVVDADGAGQAVAAAAILRSDSVAAEILEGGFDAWLAGQFVTVSLAHVPPRHDDGRTWWVTRARPKVDRIACPWLIRRFVDPSARFLFVPPGDVLVVAARQQAEPFDIADDGGILESSG